LITLAEARQIVDGALAEARDKNLPPMTVAVLDAAGELVAFGREDGSSLYREKISRGKAKGALGMGRDSRALAAQAVSHPAFIGAVAALVGGELIPVAGGVLVRDGSGVVIGAVGVSGHVPDQDEAIAFTGIASAGFSTSQAKAQQ
jgi:uncharacterized protein GlcG (DUF336 family)